MILFAKDLKLEALAVSIFFYFLLLLFYLFSANKIEVQPNLSACVVCLALGDQWPVL